MFWENASLDLCARLVVMASYLYYRHDESMMSDEEFDQHCVRLSKNFDRLSDVRKFCLGDARSIRSSGYHVYVTVLAQDACIWYANERGWKLDRSRFIFEWKMSRYPYPKEPLRYATLMD